MCSSPSPRFATSCCRGRRADRRAHVPAGRPPPAARARVLLRRRLGARLARYRRAGVPAARERGGVCGRLDRLPAGARGPVSRRGRGLLRRNVLGRRARRRARARRDAAGRGRRKLGRQPRRRGRNARTRPGGPSLVFQLLVYPPLDHRAATPSMREPSERPFFGPEDVGVVLVALSRRPGRRREPVGLAAPRPPTFADCRRRS